MNDQNSKKFLDIELIDFSKKFFSIYFLDLINNIIQLTNPSSTIQLNNLIDYPTEWVFYQDSKIPLNITNPKHYPNPQENINVIQIHFIEKTDSTQKTITIHSRSISPRF